MRVAYLAEAPGEHTVYNLEVHHDHTHFVGEEGVWAHGAYAGRWGSAATRAKNADVAAGLQRRGWSVTYWAGTAEESMPNPPGGRRGSAYPDITAIKDGRKLRINTIDTLRDGTSPTAREARNAARIRGLLQPGEHLVLIPK